jgi:peptidyl-prolyl cis-trans isomerase SurA
MFKFLMSLAFGVSLNATMVAGVAIVVKDKAITLHDIQKEMQISRVSKEVAINTLIRQKLEESEIKSRKISVTNSEVYEEIKETAKRNNMSISQLYEATLNSNGISSSELKKKMKQKLLAKKLYASIAYSKASKPTESELKEYYELHKDEFSHPESFSTIVYQTFDKQALVNKIQNPMYYAPQIQTKEEELPYNKIAPELARILQSTKVNSFTPVLPDGQGGHLSFYIKAVHGAKEIGFENLKMQIENTMMGKKREQVLGDYFARLKDNAEINVLRTIE